MCSVLGTMEKPVNMPVKTFLAMVAALAVAAGFALPRPHGAEAKAASQVQMLEIR